MQLLYNVAFHSMAIYDFLLTYRTNHGPISYHFRGNGDFSWKSIFPSRLFNATAEAIPLSLGIGAFMDKKLESLRCRTEIEVRRYLRPSGYNNTRTLRVDGRIDGRTDEHQLTVTAKTALRICIWIIIAKLHRILRQCGIASRGKMYMYN